MTSTKIDSKNVGEKMSKCENLTVLIRRTVKAPAARAFRAWTEVDQMKKWFGCNDINSIEVTQDFVVGGQYKIVAASCSGAGTNTVHGTFKEIIPNKKVVYTWNNESPNAPAQDTVVSVEFIDHGDTTEIVLEHTRFAVDKSAEGHSFGWNQSLDKFETLLAS